MSSSDLYACSGGYGDCKVAYRCDETYSISKEWCYPSDAVMTCDTSVSPPKCDCVCPEGGCTECAVPQDDYTSALDCAKPMIILDKIFDYSGLGSLKGTVDMHYEKEGYVSSCGTKNYKYNFFTIRIYYPCGTEGSIPNVRIKWCDLLFPSEKKDGDTKSDTFTIKKQGNGFQAKEIGVNDYYAARPMDKTVQHDDGIYRLLKMHFSEQIKVDPYNIGEFDENYFNEDFVCSTNLGPEYCVWRNLKFCEKYNDTDKDDTDFDGDHGSLVGDVWIAVGIIGATFFGGPAAFLAAPLLLIPAMEEDLLRRQGGIDKDRKCYNSKLFYYMLWDNFKQVRDGNVPTCDESDRPGYCKTNNETAESGITVPISQAMPYYPNRFSLYKGGSYKINTPPVASYETTDNFSFFDPTVKVTFQGSGVSTDTELTANSSFIHDHDASYGYHLRFQIEDANSVLNTPKLCLYSCRKSNASPAYCTNETKSLYDLIVTETDNSERSTKKSEFLVPYSEDEDCVDYPALSAENGDKIVLTSLYADSNGYSSYNRPIANVKLYNNSTLMGSYDLKLYEETIDSSCDIYGTTDLRKRVNRECQLGAVFHSEMDYVNYPIISFNSTDFMNFYLFINSDLLDYDQDNTRYQAYIDSREVLNATSLESDVQTIVDYYDDSSNSAGDNTPDHYCSLYNLRSDISSTNCTRYNGMLITCDSNSCSGGPEASLKTTNTFRDLMCVHGLIREKKTHSGNVGYYQLDNNGNEQLAYNIDATTTFDILPYDTNDTTGLIENEYYNYAQGMGITAKNNLCFPLPYPEPQLTFAWNQAEPSPDNPLATIYFVNAKLNTSKHVNIDGLDNGGSGIVTQERDYRYDYYNRYHIKSINDNGIFFLNVYRYDLPNDNSYNPTPVLRYLETLNTCPETSDLISGVTLPETNSTIDAFGSNKYHPVEAECEKVDDIEKTVTGRCDSYGNWSTDGSAANSSCTVKCGTINTTQYTLLSHVNTTGENVAITDNGTCNGNYVKKDGAEHAVTAVCTNLGTWSNITNNCEVPKCTFSGNVTIGTHTYTKLNRFKNDCSKPEYDTSVSNLAYNFPAPVTLEAGNSINVDCDELTYGGNSQNWLSGDSQVTFSCNADGAPTITNNCAQKCWELVNDMWRSPGYYASENSPIGHGWCNYSISSLNSLCRGTCSPNGQWTDISHKFGFSFLCHNK